MHIAFIQFYQHPNVDFEKLAVAFERLEEGLAGLVVLLLLPVRHVANTSIRFPPHSSDKRNRSPTVALVYNVVLAQCPGMPHRVCTHNKNLKSFYISH